MGEAKAVQRVPRSQQRIDKPKRQGETRSIIMGLPDLRPARACDDAMFATLLGAAIAAVSGDTDALPALERDQALAAKGSKSALKALVLAVREAARSSMTPA